MQTFTDKEARSLIAQFEDRLKAKGEQTATWAERTMPVVDILGQDRRHWANGLGRFSSSRRAERPNSRARLAPLAEFRRMPPYPSASADDEKVADTVTWRIHADAATGRAESWALTYFDDPTADRYSPQSYCVQNAMAWLYDVVLVPNGCTSLAVTASILLDGVVARLFGPIPDVDGTERNQRTKPRCS